MPGFFARTVILRPDRKFLALLQWTPEGPLWNLPGGKVEPGESPPAAASRELREETTLVYGASELAMFCSVSAAFAGIPWLGYFFLAGYRGDHVAIGEPDRIARIAWLTLDESRASPAHQETFSEVAALALSLPMRPFA